MKTIGKITNFFGPIFWLYFLSFVYAAALFFCSGSRILSLESGFFSLSLRGLTSTFLILIYMWIPGFVALYFMRQEKYKIPVFRALSFSVLDGVLLAIASLFITILVSCCFAPFNLNILLAYMPQVFDVSNSLIINAILFLAFLITLGFFLACTLFFIYFLGAEPMFRGLLYKKFQKFPFYLSALFIALLYYLWQLPYLFIMAIHKLPYFINTASEIEILMRFFGIPFVQALLTTPILLHLRQNSNNVYSSTAFQGFVLFSAFIPMLFYLEPNEFLLSGRGLSGFIALLILNVMLYLKRRKKALHAPVH